MRVTSDEAAGVGHGENPGTAPGGEPDAAGVEESSIPEWLDGNWQRRGSLLAVGVVAVVLVWLGSLYFTGRIETAYATVESAVTHARGWPGLGVVFTYSALIAVVLPLPSEVVLAAPLELGLSQSLQLALVVLASGLGKAVGSVAAFHLGQEAKRSGPVIRWLRRSRVDVVAWSEHTAVELARRFGYVGLAVALSVPFFPDTISIYAFSVLGQDYRKFAVAAFAGSVGRLLVTLGLAGAVLALL